MAPQSIPKSNESDVRVVEAVRSRSIVLSALAFAAMTKPLDTGPQATFTVTSFEVADNLISEREKWLYANPRAYAMVCEGIRQASQDELTYLGSFAEYADLDIDD